MNKKKLLSLIGVLLLAVSNVFSQQLTYTGVVSDNNGEFIPGATILVKGTYNGTNTDANGAFTISASKGTTLVVSFIGYIPQEKVLADETKLSIVLKENVVGLGDVIVVGYGTQSKRTVTSAITKVDGESITNASITSIGEGLKGKISGARVYSTNNTPGADPSIVIRGGSSINRSNEPLVLVDGIERSMAGINSNDIESLEVLKDAASTAIYGARASNGVILISTKHGSHNTAPTVTFEANMAYQTTARMYDFMNARDYINMVRPAVALGPHPSYNNVSGYSASSGNTESSIYSTRYLSSGETVPKGYQSMADPLDPSKTLIFQDNDWLSKIFKPSLWQNYYMNVTGGNDIIRYSASVGSTSDGGVAIGTGYDRLTAHANADVNISKKLVLTTGFDFSNTNTEAYTYMDQYKVLTRGLAVPATQKFYDALGVPTKGYNASSPTPLFYDYMIDDFQKANTVSLNGALEWTIINGLKAHVQGSYYNKMYEATVFQRANVFNGSRPSSDNITQTSNSKIDAYLNYNKTFNNVHSLAATAGYSFQENNFRYLFASGSGASSDQVPTMTASSIPTDVDGYNQKFSLLGYFGRFVYDYNKKYIAQLTFRYDGSSLFSETNHYGFFPGASLGWVVSEEPFMSSVSAINNLKLRASLGQTGNNSVSINSATGSYSTGYNYGGNAGIHPTEIFNDDLTWEKTTQMDLGFDLSVLNERISVSTDYFNKITDNLIFSKTLPNTSGYASILTNYGKVRYYGFEVEINSQNIKNDDFEWSTKLSWSYVNHYVVKLPENGNPKNRQNGVLTNKAGDWYGGIAEGERLDHFYAYQVDHIIETQDQANAALYDDAALGWRYSDQKYVKGRKEVGDYEYVDRDGDNKITGLDQFDMGVTIPKHTGGMNNYFKYKNWGLNVYVDWALGHSIYENVYSHFFLNTFANNWSLVNDVKDCWTTPGQNTKYARFTANDSDDGNKNFSRRTNVFAYKADYLCLREISLQYNVDPSLFQRYGIKGMTLTLSGNNLHYFTALPGMLSPENGTGNPYASGFNVYPPIRRIAFGAKITF